MTRLLLLSCSRQKRQEADILPAIERYDGPAFRVVRRFQHQNSQAELDVHILSARAGLIPSSHPTPLYDQRITSQRAAALAPAAATVLRSLLHAHSYEAVCICMGKDYARVLDGYREHIPPEVTVTAINGSSGKMLAGLHDWLYGAPPALPTPPAPPQEPVTVCLRGVALTLTAAHVIERAGQALREGYGNPSNFQAWYVNVDGQQVAPKWLVGVITGIPVGGFTTGEARRVLNQLGIEVQRL